MGIKGLWSIMSPYSEKKSLHEIQGEVVAIDLAGWICDSQNVSDFHIKPRLYLRNLFFRTAFLLLADINPIFVLEGDAPELKRSVMATRNALHFKSASKSSGRTQENISKKKPAVTRQRFKNVLSECESLLKSMGVRCIKGQGEAEATCADLSVQGLVDAVVSQDSDCFAYGARRVYRNFSVSSASGGGALQGSIDCYDAEKIYLKSGFGRNKMVALALLCGSDYGAGACGSSVNTVTSFLHTVPDGEVMQRLSSWVHDDAKYVSLARWCEAPGVCSRCGHAGRAHSRAGCPACGTHRACEDTGHKSKLAQVKCELSLRQRALTCGMPFPDPEIIKEFLESNATPVVDINNLEYPTPNLIKFMKIMTRKLEWTERYCVEKFLPVLTKSHLQKTVISRTIKPLRIVKKRKPKGVPSYEVIWTDLSGLYDGLIPDDQFDDVEDVVKPWTTTECQELMRRYYPQVVEEYEESIKKPEKTKKRTHNKKKEGHTKTKSKKKSPNIQHSNDITNISNSMKKINLSSRPNSSALNVSVSVTSLKRKYREKRQKKMDSFVVHKKRKLKSKSFKESITQNDSCRDSYGDLQCEKNKENRGLLDYLNSSENYEENDLSDIVNDIVSSAPQWKTAQIGNGNMVKLIFDNKYSAAQPSDRFVFKDILNSCSTPNGSPVSKKNEKTNYKLPKGVNTSSFFDKFSEEPDAFEMSLQCENSVIIMPDQNDTLNYSLPDVYL